MWDWPQETLEQRIQKHIAWYERNYPQLLPKRKKRKVSLAKRRKAREDRAGNGWTKLEWNECLRFFGGKCLRCNIIGVLVPDHVLPLMRGGKHHLENIQPLCHKCNLWKGLKIIDFREGRIFLPSPA